MIQGQTRDFGILGLTLKRSPMKLGVNTDIAVAIAFLILNTSKTVANAMKSTHRQNYSNTGLKCEKKLIP